MTKRRRRAAKARRKRWRRNARPSYRWPPLIVAGDVPNDGRWHSVVATFEPATGRRELRIDGVAVDPTEPWPGGVRRGGPPLTENDSYMMFCRARRTP